MKNLELISEAFASADLESTLTSLKSSLVSLDALAKGISKGEGSAGKLMKDDSLYTNLNNTLSSLDLLLQDMRNNPAKYVHFSLFGKKSE